MNANTIARMIELQGKADGKSITASEGLELVQLIGQVQNFTQGARESAGTAGIVMATDENIRQMTVIADKLAYNLEGILRYHYDGVLGNFLAKYNTLAANSKGAMPVYSSPIELYNNLDKLPAIYQGAIRKGLELGRGRASKSWSKELGELNATQGVPMNTPVSLVKTAK